jgi:integrase
LEVNTRAGHRSYLEQHFLPFFGDLPMADILPSTVQAWVTQASAGGLSPRNIQKYHVMLHGVFKRAVRDRVIAYNPCSDTELPKIVARKTHILAPDEFDHLLSWFPHRHISLVLTEIETGLRWGELVALRPRHIDFLQRRITVEETIVEVSKRHSPTGERMIVKPYPKNDEPRMLTVSPQLLEVLAAHIDSLGLCGMTCIFPSTETARGRPISRNTFRTRVWLPTLEKAELGSMFGCTTCDMPMRRGSWREVRI